MEDEYIGDEGVEIILNVKYQFQYSGVGYGGYKEHFGFVLENGYRCFTCEKIWKFKNKYNDWCFIITATPIYKKGYITELTKVKLIKILGKNK